MSPDLRRQLIFILFAGGFLAWQIYAAVRRRRRQRELTAAHRLPKPPRRRMHPLMIALAVVGVAAFLAGHYYLAPTLGENTTNVIVGVAIFVVTFPVLFLHQLRARDPLVSRATSLARAGRRSDAIGVLETALAAATPTAPRLAALGALLSEDGRPADAELSFARAADLDPSNPDYTVGRALSLCKLSRPADALAILDTARAAHPHESALPAAACLALIDLSRDDEAREYLRQADELLRTFPQNQLTGSAFPLIQLCRSRLSPSTRAFPVQTRPTL